MSYQDVITELRKKEFKPVYFLHGEEAFFMDQITRVVESEVLGESEKSFNLSVFYGKDSHYKDIRDAATRFPMMSPIQVVILKEAQEMRTLGELADYVKKPSPSTLLLICHKHKRYDMRSALGKALKKNGCVFESKALYDNQLPGWVQSHLDGLGYRIDSQALDLLVEHLGADLSKIANELEKLSINVPKGTKLSSQHIQDNIGISKEYNVFELQDALAARDSLKAHRIALHFADNPKKNPLMMTLASLYGFFSKLYIASDYAQANDLDMAHALGYSFPNPNTAKYAAKHRVEKFRLALKRYSKKQVEAVFGLLKEYDLRFKGIGDAGTPEGELLRELVVRILAS